MDDPDSLSDRESLQYFDDRLSCSCCNGNLVGVRRGGPPIDALDGWQKA